MKQFKKAIYCTCVGCYCSETVVTNAIKHAKHILKENYGWIDTIEGMICSECVEHRARD